MPQPLTARQVRFVHEYLFDLNATQAAIRAGYSKQSAKKTGFLLLQQPHVCLLLQDCQRIQLTRLDIKAVDVLEGLRRVAFSDIRQAYNPDAQQMRRLDELPDELVGALDSIKTDAAGHVLEFRLSSRVSALDKLAKHLNLLEPLPEPTPGPAVQVNANRKYLDRLSTDELLELRRIMLKDGVDAQPLIEGTTT